MFLIWPSLALKSLCSIDVSGEKAGEGIDVGCPVAPPSLSGPATPSAISILSSRISWGSGGSSSLRFLRLRTVFSFISQRTEKRAGFILWQLRVCFLACASSRLWLVILRIWSRMLLMSEYLGPSPSPPCCPSCTPLFPFAGGAGEVGCCPSRP